MSTSTSKDDKSIERTYHLWTNLASSSHEESPADGFYMTEYRLLKPQSCDCSLASPHKMTCSGKDNLCKDSTPNNGCKSCSNLTKSEHVYDRVRIRIGLGLGIS